MRRFRLSTNGERIISFVFAYTVFFVLALTLYTKSIGANFVSDDWHWIYRAEESAHLLPDFLKNYEGTAVGGSYNPLSSLWVNLFYATFGRNPFPYHVGSVALHALTALMVVALCRAWLAAYNGLSHVRGVAATSYIIGALYLSWPTFVEAVAWVASTPHLLAAFFYVCSVLFYIRYRTWQRKSELVLSLVAGFLALMSKETAVSLPMVIFVIELFFVQSAQKKISYRIFLRPALFAILTAGFLVLRHHATGLVFGTYAERYAIFRPLQAVNTFLTFLEEFATAGFGRAEWMGWYWGNPQFAAIVSCLTIAVLLVALIRRMNAGVRTALMCFAVTTIPYLTLGFHRLSPESERYAYVPFVFLFIALCSWVARIRHRVRFQGALVILFFATSIVTFHKAGAWKVAGAVSTQIVSEFAEIARSDTASLYWFVGMPDTIDGAHVFRNNIHEAVRLNYPAFSAEIELIPVYLQLRRDDYADVRMDWEFDERGFFAHSRDGRFIVTGVPRHENDRFVFELWNYDYEKFTSDTIRFILRGESLEALRTGALRVVTWNEGRLTRLHY